MIKNKYILCYDPARNYDGSILGVFEIVNDKQLGYKLKVANVISMVDTSTKNKTPLPMTQQLEIIKETIIKFDEDISEEQVETLTFIFNNKLKGKPLEEIDRPLEEYIFSQMNYSLKVIKPVMEQLNKVISEENKIYLEGANKAFELPEFKSLKVAKNFINLI